MDVRHIGYRNLGAPTIISRLSEHKKAGSAYFSAVRLRRRFSRAHLYRMTPVEIQIHALTMSHAGIALGEGLGPELAEACSFV